jgi:hypothetical protein
MNSEPRYANGAMLPDSSRLRAARYISRDPDTDEISWEPSEIELQLIELGLINEEERA